MKIETYTTIKDEIKLTMQDDIDRFFDFDEKSVRLYFVRPEDVMKYLVEKYGVDDDYDLDTNGWQWDYWIRFEVEGQRYILGGDGFYQDYCSLSKDN